MKCATVLALVTVGVLLFHTPATVKAQGSDTTFHAPAQAKNPRIAAGLSMFVPGLGSVYSGESIMGAIHFGTFVGALGMVSSAHLTAEHESLTAYSWVSVTLLVISYVWAVVDATFSAERANEKSTIGPPPPRQTEESLRTSQLGSVATRTEGTDSTSVHTIEIRK